MDLELNTWCGPEAQVASLSDDIAYFSHDIEDGIRAGFFNVEDIINEFTILKTFMKKNHNIKYKKETRRIVNEIKRFIISKMIDDLILETKKNITLLNPSSADDVREMKKPLVIFSEEMNSNIKEIRSFLMNKMYRNWKINIMTNKAKNIVSDLFKLYNAEPNLLPLEWNVGLKKTNNKTKARVISDYIAGMTDRYAIREHQKLFDITKGWY